jgi:hypothetical protein
MYREFCDLAFEQGDDSETADHGIIEAHDLLKGVDSNLKVQDIPR